MRLSLRAKIVLASAFFVLIGGSLATYSVFVYTKATLIQQKKESTERNNKERVKETEGIMKVAENAVDSISKNESVVDFLYNLRNENETEAMPEEQAKDEISENAQEDEDSEEQSLARVRDMERELSEINLGNIFDIIYLTDSAGNVVVSTDETLLGNNYSFRDYYKGAVEEGSYVDFSVGITTKKAGYYFSKLVKKDGKTIGLVMGKMGNKIIDETIENNTSFVDSNSMLLDRFGVVVYSNKPERLYKSSGPLGMDDKQAIIETKRYANNSEVGNLKYDFIIPAIKSGENSLQYDFFDEADGEEEIVDFVKIGKYPFYFVSEFEKDVFVKEAIRESSILAGIILATIVAVLIMVSYVVYELLRPLDELKKITESIAKKDFDKRVKIKTGDELEEFGETLNHASEELKDFYENMDKKVKERTRALEETNRFMVGRELRMLELKRQLAELGSLKSKNKKDTHKGKSLKIESEYVDDIYEKNDSESRQKAMLNILEDIDNEKKKAESLAGELEKFKLAVDNASDHIAITDSEGTILYGNKALEKITGYSLDEIIGKKAGTRQNWGGNMEKEFYMNLWETIKKEKQVFRGHMENIRKDGEKYQAEVSVSPVLDENKEVKFFVAIERDITKEIEVDIAKTEFVSLASHQLRTPLTAFKWNVEMLLDMIPRDKNKKNKEYREIIKEMDQTSEGMIDLVNGLLNVSRIDLGTFAVDPKMIYPKHIVEVVLRELKPGIESKKIRIVSDYEERIGAIAADPKLLKIIIQNLLSNAVKYSPEKGLIEIKLKKEKDFMLFSVKDNGMGIPKKDQPKIFSKLFRAENAIQKIADGTGLGLYVAKAVVEQAGGKIWFESKENFGTTFSFNMPLSGMKKKEGNRELTPTK